MVGPIPAREEETARLTGARGDFVGSLGRRVEGLRAALRAVEQSPGDTALRNGLLRRVHALSSAARVLGFASVAEALTEAERRLRNSEFADVARSFDLLPSLLLGVPVSLRAAPEVHAERAASKWPLSVLIFGAQALADAIQAIADTHVECERTEDLARAREQARLFGPDLAVIDADRPGARELVETFVGDPLVEPVPVVVVGDFESPEAASSYVALGAARVLQKPIGAEALQRTVIELRALAAEPRAGREPLGELSVEALTARISAEIRRGLAESVEPSARGSSVGFGDGADVMAAVWGAVARVRELVTLRSSGAVRFNASGPEGAVPMAAWGDEERRAGERGALGSEARSGDGVTLQGRRIVVADDDPAVVWFMSGVLRALGVEVLEAHDGARALALTYDSWPDLVVSDVLMPRLDGFSLCHEIKRDVAVRDVPVILLSWKEDLLQRVRELGGAADGYLRKEAAAGTVAERLREVLRPRARVEQRIRAGGDARGRLDGLTPRLILELASAGERDVRIGIRDAVYLYEVQVRRGRLCSATRSSVDGNFERGPFVLAALLGVSAGRFVVEADASACRVDFDGTVAELLKAPIERARAALSSTSAAALVGVTRVQVALPVIEGYLACTPEPARGLLDRIIAGASPRELITSGAVAPRLLEAVLSDLARRGAIGDVQREGAAPALPSDSSPPRSEPEARAGTVALAQAVGSAGDAAAPASAPLEAEPVPAAAPAQAAALSAPPPNDALLADTVEEGGWFSLQLEASAEGAPLPSVTAAPTVAAAPTLSTQAIAAPLAAPAPVEVAPTAALPSAADARSSAPPEASLPFSRDVTPPVDRSWDKITEGVFGDLRTAQGLGNALPAVAVAQPLPDAVASRADELDVLARALTQDTPSPGLVDAPTQTQVLAAIAPPGPTQPASVPPGPTQPASVPGPAQPAEPASLPPGPAQPALRSVPSSRVSALKSPLASVTPPAGSAPSGWLLRLFVIAGLAFIAAYVLVSYYRVQPPSPLPSQPLGPAPAAS